MNVLRLSSRVPLLPLVFVTPLLATASVLAQTAPAAESVASAAADEAIVLSPFEIHTDRDVGYTAASALAGGRTDMPLKETPAAVSVMTREFIDDVGATNFQQIADWGVNSQPTYSGSLANNPFDFGINLRGPNSSFPSRNYFIWYINSDSYATERYEYARGPNGVLFGDGNIGGIVTIFSKQPRFGRAFRSVNFRADTWGGYSTRIDVNQPLNDKVALRLNLLDVHDEYWRDRTPFRNRGAHLGGSVRLTKDLTFRTEGEIGGGQRAITMLTYADQASYWDRSTSYGGTTAPSTTGTGVGRVSTSTYTLYVPAVPQAGISDWSTQYKTNGSGIAIRPEARGEIVNFPVLPSREYNLQPGNSWQRLDFYNYNFYLEQRFSEKLFAQVAYSHLANEATDNNSAGFNTYTIDVNRLLPNGQTNPKYGVPYSDNQKSRGVNNNRVDDIRGFLAYRDEFRWFRFSLNGIAGSRMDRYNYLTETVYRTNGTNPNFTSAANQFRYRFYWDEPGSYNIPDGLPDSAGSGYTFGYIPTNIINQRKWIDYLQFAGTAHFFHDRLTLLFGVRRDGFHMTQQSSIANATTGLPQMGATIIPAGSVNPVAVVGAKLRQQFNPVSKNAGFTYFPFPWVGVYGNYSETFGTPNAGANLIDGTAPGVSRSKGEDYGIKFVLGTKVDARLNYYESKQDDLLVSSINTTEINRLWTNVGRTDLANIQWRDTQSLSLKGWEFELTANPTRSLRLTYNLAFPESENVNVYPRLKAYVAQNLPTWQAGANDPANTQAAQIRQDINTVQAALGNLVTGAMTSNTTKYTSNVYATYTIRDGMLKNLAFGLGANLRGKTKVGTTAASAYEYLYSKSYYVVAAHAAYEKRFDKVTARFQVNVANLLDNDDLVYTAYGDYRVGGSTANPATRLPTSFRYLDPRKITLSTTLTF